jgi:hypothetical protein
LGRGVEVPQQPLNLLDEHVHEQEVTLLDRLLGGCVHRQYVRTPFVEGPKPRAENADGHHRADCGSICSGNQVLRRSTRGEHDEYIVRTPERVDLAGEDLAVSVVVRHRRDGRRIAMECDRWQCRSFALGAQPAEELTREMLGFRSRAPVPCGQQLPARPRPGTKHPRPHARQP